MSFLCDCLAGARWRDNKKPPPVRRTGGG